MCRTLKPGNGDLCGTVPKRIMSTTGLRSSYLGNCTGLPLRPQRALPPAAGLNATLVAPAQVTVIAVSCTWVEM